MRENYLLEVYFPDKNRRDLDMKFFNSGSISRKMALLVLFAVLPALVILLYSGIEQRQQSIESAKQDVLLLTQTMADAQQEITRSTRQILSTLSLLPEIQAKDPLACSKIFKAVLEKNPNYNNIVLTDPNGDVIASGRPFTGTNLADRKHVRDALKKKDFSVGEYIVSRVGPAVPAFPFAYPVLDKKGDPKAILTTVIKLDQFSRFHDLTTLPENSFVGITDHQGIRLFYYPSQNTTNPIGKPIKGKSWEMASKAKKAGIFTGSGSDGIHRIFAFEQVRLDPGDPPYLYVWAGIPEAQILAPANAALIRNLLFMLLATLMSLLLSWMIGKSTLLTPIKTLVTLTRKFAKGDLDARSDLASRTDEFGTLTNSFNDMAKALKASQRTFQENEARFRLLMDSLDALVYVADMDTYEVLFINEHGRKGFGDIVGKICWQSLQKGQSGPCPFCTNKYLLNGEGKPGRVYSWELQNTITGKWYHMLDRAIQWVDGRIVRLEVATDISGIKQTEEALKSERDKLKALVDGLARLGMGIDIVDTDYNILFQNQLLKEQFGLVPQKKCYETYVDGNKPCDFCSMVKAIKNNRVEKTTQKGSDGKYYEILSTPLPNPDGTIDKAIEVIWDVTERKLMEQELLKVKKLESVGILAGGIAHDFNNILAAIIGNIDLSLLDSNLTDKTHDLLKEALKASFRARGLTGQLLTFAKGGEPIIEAASLADVVKSSADFVLRGGKVACRYSFPDDLWLVDIDKGQISQVVQNIVLNASNAMPEGGIVEVSCENVGSLSSRSLALPKGGNYVKMTVKDSGTGIPANILEKIFDPFFSTKLQGSGLGLAITHSIISKHGGHIGVQSTEGVGTTFTVYLPASAKRSIPDKNAERADLRSKKLKILVMDDEEQVLNFIRKMLGQLGHEVVLAKDGIETIRLYNEARDSDASFDLTIMDLTIPGGMGGREAVQKILAIDPEAKVIVSSGYSNDPVMANFKDYGFCSAIEKPFQLLELEKVINKL